MSALFGLLKQNSNEEKDKGTYHPPMMINTQQETVAKQTNILENDFLKPKDYINNLDLLSELNINNINSNDKQYLQQEKMVINNNGDHIDTLKMLNAQLQDIDIPLSEDAKILTSIISNQSSSTLSSTSTPQMEQLKKIEENEKNKKQTQSTLTESIVQSLVILQLIIYSIYSIEMYIVYIPNLNL